MITLLLTAALACPPTIKEVNDGFWTTFDEQVLQGARIQCAFRFAHTTGNVCVKKIWKIADRRHKILCGPKTPGGLPHEQE